MSQQLFLVNVLKGHGGHTCCTNSSSTTETLSKCTRSSLCQPGAQSKSNQSESFEQIMAVCLCMAVSTKLVVIRKGFSKSDLYNGLPSKIKHLCFQWENYHKKGGWAIPLILTQHWKGHLANKRLQNKCNKFSHWCFFIQTNKRTCLKRKLIFTKSVLSSNIDFFDISLIPVKLADWFKQVSHTYYCYTRNAHTQ